jgi:TRAP-type transport system periplasmic protein
MVSSSRCAAAAFAAAVSLLAAPAFAQAPALPPGPPVAIQMVTQLSPSIPQYTRVDIPMLREALPQRSGGRIANAMLPTLNKELERVGIKIVAFYPFPGQVLFCRDPVTSLADLKGRRVRTPGGSQNDFIQSIGGQPVAIGFPEVYSALERGVVDCAVTGTATGNGARWYEVTRHLYTLPIQWGVAAYAVNLAWWNRLDPAVRDFLQATMNEVEEAQWKLGAELTEDGIQCNAGNAAGCKIGHVVTNRPMTITRETPADVALLREAMQKVVLPAFVKRCGV